jgi:hypothetical protein
LIYASKQLDKEMAGSLNINYTKLPRGAIIGIADPSLKKIRISTILISGDLVLQVWIYGKECS